MSFTSSASSSNSSFQNNNFDPNQKDGTFLMPTPLLKPEVITASSTESPRSDREGVPYTIDAQMNNDSSK